ALHAWLEGLRKDGAYTRPELQFGEANEKIENLDTRAQALFRALVEKLPEDRDTWTDEHHALWLLAHQVDYFRREDKSAWWEYYRVHELEHEELLDERKAITGLKFVAELPKKKGDRNPTHRYRFPEQEVSIDTGDNVVAIKGEN